MGIVGFISATRHFKLAFEDPGIGGVTDGDEHALHGEIARDAVGVFESQAGDAALVAQDFVQGVIP